MEICNNVILSRKGIGLHNEFKWTDVTAGEYTQVSGSAMNLDNLKVQRSKNGWTQEQVTQAEKIAIKKADTYNTVTTRLVRPAP